MIENRGPTSCLVVGNYCHDVLMKDGVVLAESLGGAAAFISAVLDGVAIASTFVSKVGPDFAYSVARSPFVSESSKTTVFHAHFSSQVQRHDRVLKRVESCASITPSDLPASRRFEFGMAVGVAGEILPETLERMLDICDTVFVDVQALIRVFDPADGTVSLVHLRDSGFDHLVPRIGFLKASSDEAPYVGVEAARKECCVVVTNGEKGCTVYYRNVEHRIAPFPTVQVDPTGAGDSFLGGLVVGLIEGMPVPDAALLGNFFGSLTVGQLGLPKFDFRVLQAVKDELQRRRLKMLGHERLNGELVFVKPIDHEDFRMALVRAKTLPVRECQQDQLLPVFYKQRDNLFHPAWTWSLPSFILHLPYSVIEAMVWSCVVYYAVGFSPEAGRFLRYMFVLFSVHQMALGLFRTMAALASDIIIANTFGSAALLIIFLLGGYILPKEMIKPWWLWAFWVSPLSYGQQAISVDEFTAKRWMERSAGNTTLGNMILQIHSLPSNGYWYWLGVAALLGYALFFNITVTAALSFLNQHSWVVDMVLLHLPDGVDITWHNHVPTRRRRDKNQRAGF